MDHTGGEEKKATIEEYISNLKQDKKKELEQLLTYMIQDNVDATSVLNNQKMLAEKAKFKRRKDNTI